MVGSCFYSFVSVKPLQFLTCSAFTVVFGHCASFGPWPLHQAGNPECRPFLTVCGPSLSCAGSGPCHISTAYHSLSPLNFFQHFHILRVFEYESLSILFGELHSPDNVGGKGTATKIIKMAQKYSCDTFAILGYLLYIML